MERASAGARLLPGRSCRFIPARACGSRKFVAFEACVRDLLTSDAVLRMDAFIQHGDFTCLEHCMLVSYYSYLCCRLLRLDCGSAARGGLLHDLFLYDWHVKSGNAGLHAFRHPQKALDNANACFALNPREQDIIRKHMWPLTVFLPKYPETLVVCAVDKYFAVAEFIAYRTERVKRTGGTG